MAAIKLFQLLEPKLGERATEGLIELVDLRVKENNEEMQEFNLKVLATKDDLWGFKEEVKGGIVELKSETQKFRSEFKEEISRLELKISDFKSDILRWVFVFFVSLMLAILGLYFKH